MIGIISSAITGLFSGIGNIGKAWLENKKAKIEGEIQLQEKAISGDIDYNVWAQKAGQSSWKDEWLTLWTTGVVTALFIPQTQQYVIDGFVALNNSTPDWFAWCFMGMYVAVYGLKGWKGIKGA